jgi:general secretion pathway protein A
MYLDYFGLKERPFSIAPDPRYLYMSERHREALAHLLYGVSGQGGFIVLTGEVGTGKTTICRCFLNQVPANTDVAFIINPKLSARELMASICDELNITYSPSASIKILNDVINQYLLAAHADNRHTVLIIDEAQNLRIDVLEQLRLLTNLETSEKKLLQIILLGQPELRDMLAQNDLRQLAQRVTARYHLNELNKMEVGAYAQCRLAVAGRRGRLFTIKAINTLYKLSGGVPRLINLIADRALLGAYASQSEMVEANHIKSAYREIQGEKVKSKKIFSFNVNQVWLLPLIVVCCIVSAGIAFTFNKTNIMPSELEVDSNRIVTTKVQIDKNATIETTSNRKKTLVNNKEVVATNKPQSDSYIESISNLKQHKNDKFNAYKSIFNQWNVNYTDEPFMLACEYAELYGLRCLHKNGNWRSVLKLNRPAVLTLITDYGETLYISLLAIRGDDAYVSHQDNAFWVGLAEIDRYWLGEYSIVWKLPPYKSNTISPGQQKEAEWVSSSLETIQRNKKSRSQHSYRKAKNEPLEAKLKDFQLKSGLVPDGILGSMTLIHINSQLELDHPILLGGV